MCQKFDSPHTFSGRFVRICCSVSVYYIDTHDVLPFGESYVTIYNRLTNPSLLHIEPSRPANKSTICNIFARQRTFGRKRMQRDYRNRNSSARAGRPNVGFELLQPGNGTGDRGGSGRDGWPVRFLHTNPITCVECFAGGRMAVDIDPRAYKVCAPLGRTRERFALSTHCCPRGVSGRTQITWSDLQAVRAGVFKMTGHYDFEPNKKRL